MKRILACVDASSYTASVCALTAWAASRLEASVEVLHVVQRKDAVAARHDLSGAIGLGVKSELLEELTRIDQAEGKLAIERGRLLLKEAERILTDAGLAHVRTLHRHGGIVETIIEREADADLVIIGKRGASSKVHAPKTVVIAFDGSAMARKAVECVANSPLFAGLPIHLVTAGADDAHHRKQLDEAAARLQERAPAAMLADRSQQAPAPIRAIVSGHADKVIGEYVGRQTEAMLVMGAYGHSPLRTLIVGSTTTTMIRTVHVPVLLVR